MPTPFSDIYERAIFRFADHEFLRQGVQVAEDVLEKYLVSAKTDFAPTALVDLSDCDMDAKQFNIELDDDVIEILATGIAYYWLSFKAMNSELLKNVMNSKDYYYYSPANLLKEVQTLRNTIRDEFYSKIRRYSYVHSTNLGSLKP